MKDNYLNHIQGVDNRVLHNAFAEVSPFQFGGYLAGGSLVSLFGDVRPIKDFDCYFPNEQSYESYFLYLIAKGANLIHEGVDSNIKTVRLQTRGSQLKIQLIGESFYDSPQHVIDNFDINASRLATNGTDLFLSFETSQDIQNKKITFHNVRYPTSTLKRIIRYTSEYGYSIDDNMLEYFVKHIFTLGKKNQKFKNFISTSSAMPGYVS